MRRNPLQIAAVFLTACMGVMCAGILVRFTVKNVLVDRLGADNAIVRALVGERLTAVRENERGARLAESEQPADTAKSAQAEPLDLSAAYPLAAQTEKSSASGFAGRYAAEDAALRARLESLQNNLLWYTTRYLPVQQLLEDGQNAMWRGLGVRFVDFTTTDNSILLPNGYEATGQAYTDITPLAQSTAAFDDWCKERDIPLLYVQVPSKLCEKEQPQNGAQYLYYGNSNADRMLSALEQAGVATLDLRTSLHAQGLAEHYSLFYPHDGHWLPTSAFWAAGEAARALSETLGWEYAPALYEADSYTALKAPGQIPLKGTLRDDSAFYLPNFDTAFTLENPETGESFAGTLGQTYFYPADPGAQLSYYTAARYGNIALEVLHNEQPAVNADKKILVLGDSFSRYLFPYLALDAGETIMLHPYHFSGSIRAYIEREQPDAILMMTIPGRLAKGDAWFALQ